MTRRITESGINNSAYQGCQSSVSRANKPTSAPADCWLRTKGDGSLLERQVNASRPETTALRSSAIASDRRHWPL